MNEELQEQKNKENQSQKEIHIVKKGGALNILAFLISLGSLGSTGYIWLEMQKSNQIISDSLSNKAIVINTNQIKDLTNKISLIEQEKDRLEKEEQKNNNNILNLSDQLKIITDIQKDLSQQNNLFNSQLITLPKHSDLITQKELIINLQETQQQLSKHLDEAISMNRQRWRVIEADHLARLSQLRLNALQDLDSAEALLSAANNILIEQNDPTSYSVRQFLQKSLQEIKITERPDRTTIFLTLGGIIDNVRKLTPYHLYDYKSSNEIEQLAKETEKEAWYKNILEVISKYFRISFSAKETIKPMIAGENLEQIKLALSLSLEQAQWSALNGQTEIYKKSLDQSLNILKDHFNSNQQSTKVMINELKQLQERIVWVKMPDMTNTLEALDLYIKRKQSIDNKKETSLISKAESLKNNFEVLNNPTEIQE